MENKQKQLKIKKEKQVKAIKDNTSTNYYKNELLLSKEKEIFKNTYSERLDRLEGLTKKINYYDLNLTVESSCNETDFIDLEDSFVFLNNIRGRTFSSLLVARYFLLVCSLLFPCYALLFARC